MTIFNYVSMIMTLLRILFCPPILYTSLQIWLRICWLTSRPFFRSNMATRSNFAYKKEFVIKVTKVLCYFFCIVMFLVLMGDVWDKFNDGITTIGLVEKNLNGNNQSLPCLTFCPEQGFKQRGLYFQEDQYMKQTFNKVGIKCWEINFCANFMFNLNWYQPCAKARQVNQTGSPKEAEGIRFSNCFDKKLSYNFPTDPFRLGLRISSKVSKFSWDRVPCM